MSSSGQTTIARSNWAQTPNGTLTGVWTCSGNVTSADHGTFSAVLSGSLCTGLQHSRWWKCTASCSALNKSFNQPTMVTWTSHRSTRLATFRFLSMVTICLVTAYQNKTTPGMERLSNTSIACSLVTPNFPAIAETSGAENASLFGSSWRKWEVKQIFGPPLGDTHLRLWRISFQPHPQIDAVDSPMYGVPMAEQGRAFLKFGKMQAMPRWGNGCLLPPHSLPKPGGPAEQPLPPTEYISNCLWQNSLTQLSETLIIEPRVLLRTPNTTPAESEYEVLRHHIPCSSGGYVWVEGLGVYVYHALPPDNSYDPPTALWCHCNLVGGQQKAECGMYGSRWTNDTCSQAGS